MSISVVLICKNAEKQLPRSLESLAFADELIVFDVRSTDRSVQIARKYASRVVISKKDSLFVEPLREEALALAKMEWTLVLDADESIPKTLAKKLQELSFGEKKAYWLPRSNSFAGYELRHTGWWPDYQMRFFPTGTVKWGKQIHAAPVISVETAFLPAQVELAIAHDNYRDTDDYLQRFNRYTNIESQQVLQRIRMKKEREKLRPVDLFQSFSDEFFRRFFLKEAYKDGNRGLYLSFAQSLYQMTIQMKVAEDLGEQKASSKQEILALEKSLQQFQRDLRYWRRQMWLQNHLPAPIKQFFAMIKKK